MQNRARAVWILIGLAYGFTVISFNLIQIQLVQHDKFWRLAVENHLHPEVIPPERGSIFDGDGNILAQTQTTTDVFLDGKLLDHPEQDLPRIAEILQLPADQLIAGFDRRNRDANLAKDVDDSVVTRLRALKLDSIILVPRERRYYPNDELAAQVLGFVDENGHGLAGVEKEMDTCLSGVPGERMVERDARKNEIAGYQTRETPAVDGYDVTLTIKRTIQHVIEEQLDQIVQTYQPDAASIIVMDPHTGEILALGSRPTYDPNDRKTFSPENIRDRCVTDMVEPGSIFKIITLAGAINDRRLNLDTPVFCENGSYYYGDRYLHDDEPHGWLPAIEVMAQSSNIGFAKIAINCLGEQRLYQYATAFGIGRPTGLFHNQDESAGLLRPVDKWSALSITRIPMGQEVAATPIQMITAMSVIANGGRLVIPRLTSKVTDETGRVIKIYQPSIVGQVVSPDTAHDIARALQQVTIDGTAKSVHIEDANGDRYSYAGKTGTAQKFVDGQYSHTQFVSSFIGFLPAEDPAFVALVMVDNPRTAKYYGAEVSAPVFANVARQVAQILNISPDEPAPTAPAAPPVLTSNNPTTP
jgi:cell division protein FtsI (penicillin-binding protein 3)/stage V sporulation protein D (sporulation-specific penicillin-binding protein)